MGVLAERTHQCSATLTGIIDRLIKMGLVERQRDESDRRLVLVRITEHGRRLVHESLLARFEALKRYLMQFDDENRQQLIQLLRKSLAMMKTELENLSPLETSEHPTSVACP
jgi:DNA-binding MarR family transcriptional regulator